MRRGWAWACRASGKAKSPTRTVMPMPMSGGWAGGLTGPKEPDKPADLEIVHPDVKRMLLQARAFVEGMRALCCWTTLNIAISHSKRPEAETAGLLADLMTPV